jgi:hypothetical protein
MINPAWQIDPVRGRHDLPRHGWHQVLECHHHGLEPAGNFLVSGFEPPGAASFGIEIRKQPVALLGQEAELLLKRRHRDRFVTLREDLTQEAFELIDGGIQSISRLLQSVSLAHCAPPPSSGAAFFCQPPIKLLDARINVNVVTTDAMFNNHEPPRLVPAIAIDSAASRVI